MFQCKALDQPPLSLVFFSLKIPQRNTYSTNRGCISLLEHGRHVGRLHRRRRRRRAYAPTSNTASHDNHEKISSWVSFNFHIWDAYGAPLGGPSCRRSSGNILSRNMVNPT